MSNKIKNITASAHQLQFNNYLVTFIEQLQNYVSDEHKRLLKKYYKYYRKHVDRNQRVEFIKEFIEYISKYNKEISVCDECLFSEEPEYYPGKHIQILKGIDFKQIWKSSLMTEKTKESIWNYLRTLYVIGTYVLKETTKFDDLLKKQKDIIYNIIKSLKLEQKIKDDAAKLDEEEKLKSEENSFDFSNLTEIFGENNLITEMAIEIAKELNLPNEKLSNPVEAIRLLFGHDGSRLQEIIAKIANKLQEKLQRGGISEEQLINEAKKMNDTLVGKFKNVPGMGDIEKFIKQFAEQITKEAEEKRQNSPPGTEPSMPTIEELTANLTNNWSQMGLDNVELFKQNFSDIMSEINTHEPNPETTYPETNETNVFNENENENDLSAKHSQNNLFNDNESHFLDSETDEKLQLELDEIKKNMD